MNVIYSVTQLNQEVKELLDIIPAYRSLWVRGELSNYKAHSSGHHYMTLKDENASINAVLFRRDAMRLKFHPENGMKVILRARLSSFPRTGQVQLYVTEMIPDGAGALSLAFEQRKQKLFAEGLFAEQHKKPIPPYPTSIALVTSPTGAAVRDMLRILGERWPLAKVVLYPAQVQGADAADSICRALALANTIGEADVILCGRGGGSMEDLQAFNEETVARAVFASEIPVIAAVGHEPDVTIIDFVADLRAPTPSGAAVLAVPEQTETALALQQTRIRLYTALRRQLLQQRQRLEHIQRRLAAAMTDHIKTDRLRFSRAAATLDALSPLRVLARGYSIATDETEKIIFNAAALHPDEMITVRFAHGAADCRVTEIRKDGEETPRGGTNI